MAKVKDEQAQTAARVERVDAAIAQQLARNMKYNARLQARNSLLRKAVENINAAAANGRVCDGVAHYDRDIALQAYCENILSLDDIMKANQDDEQHGDDKA